jgi:hypothetical protein
MRFGALAVFHAWKKVFHTVEKPAKVFHAMEKRRWRRKRAGPPGNGPLKVRAWDLRRFRRRWLTNRAEADDRADFSRRVPRGFAL